MGTLSKPGLPSEPKRSSLPPGLIWTWRRRPCVREQGGVDPLRGEAQVGELGVLHGAQLPQRRGHVGLPHQRVLLEALRLRAGDLGHVGRLERLLDAVGVDVDRVDEADDARERGAPDREHDDDRDQAAAAGAGAAAGARRSPDGGLVEHAAELGGELALLGVVRGRARSSESRRRPPVARLRSARPARPWPWRPRPTARPRRPRPPPMSPLRARCAAPMRTRAARGSRRGPGGCPHRSPARTRRTSARNDQSGPGGPRQPSAARTSSISSSASVRGSRRRRPSWIRPTIGGSLARRRAASASASPGIATAGPGSSSSGSAPPPTLAVDSTTSPRPSARRCARARSVASSDRQHPQ